MRAVEKQQEMRLQVAGAAVEITNGHVGQLKECGFYSVIVCSV